MSRDEEHHGPKPTCQVWLLGALRVENEDQPIAIPPGKAQSLFAFLVLHPQVPHTRDVLADLLWPESPMDRVRRYLSNVLYRLRQVLGAEWFVFESDRVALRMSPDLWVDVWEFERLASSDDLDQLEQAINLYAGDLLPEIYDDWILARRVSLQDRYLDCLLHLAKQAEQSNRHQAAVAYYQRMISTDSLREEAYRGVMRNLASMGRLVEALAVHTQLEQLLAAEMDIQPSQRTRALAARLQDECDLIHLESQRKHQHLLHPPFVGRVAERTRLLTRLDQARAGKGGTAVLLGEAGIGKSRLLTELARAAELRGWQVAWGHSQDLSLPSPYTPLQQALAAALPRPRIQQLSQLVHPMWLQIVAPLLPAIAETLKHTNFSQPFSPEQLPTAILRLLGGLQRIAPQLLILEDVHWSDEATWPLLEELRQSLASMSVLLVLSARVDALQAQPAAWAAIEAWDGAGVPIVSLTGLNPGELEELASACGLEEHTSTQIEQLTMASGGNPLLALSLLPTWASGYRQARDRENIPIEASLAELTQQRLATLTSLAQRALHAAAVIGYRFDYEVWAAMLTRAETFPETLPTLARELERSGWLGLERHGYRFMHETLRAAIYTHMNAVHRRVWHNHALAALRHLSVDDPLQLLYHAERAGASSEASHYARQAGEQALAAFSYQSARQYFEQALALLAPADITSRYTAALGLARALDVLAEREAQREVVTLLRDLADALDDNRRRAEAAWHHANLEWITGEFTSAKVIAEAGLTQARQENDVPQQASLLEIMGRAARDLGDYAGAHQYFVQARACYLQLEDEPGVAWIEGMLGIVAQRQGRLQEAIDYHTRAMNAHRESGNLFNEMRAASGLAVALWMAGDYRQARDIFERTLTLSREVGDRRMEEASLANLGGLADILGDYVVAVDLKQQALDLSRAADNKMGIALGLCNLGITYYKLGQLERSLAAFDEAIAIDRATGRRQGEAYALHGRGVTLLEVGRIGEARRSLEMARTIRTELDERDVLISTQADLTLAALADEDCEGARAYIQAALNMLRQDDRADLREQVHYAAYRMMAAQEDAQAALEHLRQAETAMLQLASTLPSEARERLLRQDPLNRKVQAALETLTHKKQVRLVRADVPLGHRLTHEDYVLVTWTIRTPEDEQRRSSGERRRHVLKRLLDEAAAQGAAPTDQDLAAALGVSRRTIVRDMEVLQRSGVKLPTRRRSK